MAGFRNSFDGGTSGATITVENSGGASGDAFYSVDALTYSTAQVYAGTLAAASSFLYYTVKYLGLSFVGAWYLRSHIYAPALPSSASRIQSIDGSGALNQYVSVLPDGRLELGTKVSSSGYGVVATTSAAMATGQWVRVETMWDLSGPAEVRLFNNPSSATPTSVASGTLNTSFAGFSTANFITPAGWYLDEVAAADGGWIGPAEPPRLTGGARLVGTAAARRAATW
ncbi:hypothetical protein ACIBG8_07240 [Nonomuraea sp. NPDC050556]|uniref:hypothetical protein n=1 Tax=Nonomuraea sp. NPDC050556 TaxID=3364369 RepID=UPI0037AA21A1